MLGLKIGTADHRRRTQGKVVRAVKNSHQGFRRNHDLPESPAGRQLWQLEQRQNCRGECEWEQNGVHRCLRTGNPPLLDCSREEKDHDG